MELTTGTILLLVGAGGMVIALLAIPITIAVLHHQGKKISGSIHSEYEL